ncbi:histidine kinase [Streptomyces sp. NPDC048057]|uniref:sensor histidine kinase n=1 Tax=Streptomyces sp. NPDC048057 TaxID=3155628 RepID=UPI0033FF0C43
MHLPRPHRDDVFIAVAALLGGLLLWSLGLYTNGDVDRPLPKWVTLVPLVVICAQSVYRRTFPLTTLLVCTLCLSVDVLTVGSLVTVIMFSDGVYVSVVYGPPGLARRLPVITGMLTVAVTGLLAALLQVPETLLIGVLFGLVTFGPATTGAIVRNHREAADAAKLRAEQTALLAEMDRVQAVTAERSRMARELHDMVANHLSAIAIHSTAAISLDDPATTRTALDVIRENSVAGLAEMRRLIGLLRDDASADDREPTARPSLAGLESLVAQAGTNGAASGLTVTLDDRRGGQGPGEATLPAPVELAAYRIVQESLTNALKHAEPGEVHVQLVHTAGDRLTVTVTSAYGSGAGPRAPGSGAGLVGMRERVALLDGEIDAGPVPGPEGGPEKIWRVRAVLPVRDDKEPDA